LQLSGLDRAHIEGCLFGQGLRFRVGPFGVCLKTNIPSVVRHVEKLYSHSESLDVDAFIDFHIAINRVAGLRRWVRPQVTFTFDGFEPFKPLPLRQAAAMFEWGLNWCIASSSHQFVIVHSAVVEKGGWGLILPGTPGSGKSTLCAALVYRGWRLLSDEMALLSIADGLIYPVPRPVSLKNQSAQIIKSFTQQAVFGERIVGTTKGDIEHMCIPEKSMPDISAGIQAKYLVFPHYQLGSESQVTALSKGKASMSLIENTFNFNILGVEGFESISKLVGELECYDFTYPGLDEALSGIERITALKQ